jgi:hypothetical protein
MSDYRQDDRRSIPGRGKCFSSSVCVRTSNETHPTFYAMDAAGPFRGGGGKSRPERDADHLPPSSTEVKNK